MSKREELADLIYRHQYPVPEDPNIRPLDQAPNWEQEMIYRTADSVLEFMLPKGESSGLRKAIEELAAFHESYAEGKGLDLAEDDDFDRGWYGANRALVAELRQALEANPEPELVIEWGSSPKVAPWNVKRAVGRSAAEWRVKNRDEVLFQRTAPGPWLLVGDDE